LESCYHLAGERFPLILPGVIPFLSFGFEDMARLMLSQISVIQMSKLPIANGMKRLLRNCFLVCSPILLAGCQHPGGPAISAAYEPVYGARTTVNFESPVQSPAPVALRRSATPDTTAAPKETEATPTAAVQKRSDSQVGQLADGLMLVFTTLTGH
jgi:hypothetical protein